MENVKKNRVVNTALLDEMDSSASHVLKSISIKQNSEGCSLALLYVRRISCPKNSDNFRITDIMEKFGDENGDTECEMRFRNLKNESESVWVKTKLRTVENSDVSSLISAEFENITTRKSLEAMRKSQAMREALEAAHRDSSTGVYNKYFTEDIIRDKLATGDGGISMLLILDLDWLKNINDTYGHPAGDMALKTVAGIMRSQFRQDDIIGRIGGDEFMALISRVGDEASARGIVERLLRCITDVNICGFNLSVSIGCVLTETGRDDFDTLYQKADKALYHVKKNGKNNYDFYTSEND